MCSSSMSEEIQILYAIRNKTKALLCLCNTCEVFYTHKSKCNTYLKTFQDSTNLETSVSFMTLKGGHT